MPAELAARYVGEYRLRQTVPAEQTVTFTVTYDGEHLVAHWESAPNPLLERPWLIHLGEGMFVPAELMDGELFDIVTDLVFEFAPLQGTATGFEMRALGDQLVWTAWKPATVLVGLSLVLAGATWWLGIAVFLLAMRWDSSDPARLTRVDEHRSAEGAVDDDQKLREERPVERQPVGAVRGGHGRCGAGARVGARRRGAGHDACQGAIGTAPDRQGNPGARRSVENQRSGQVRHRCGRARPCTR